MSNGSGVAVDPKAEQSVFAPKQEDVCTQRTERLSESSPIAIPEQVVGSSHEFEFPGPQNLSSMGAVSTVAVEGSPEIRADWIAATPIPGMSNGRLKLRFEPTSAGEKRATLMVQVKWEDGHVEKRSIAVTAHARKIDDVPKGGTDSAPRASAGSIESDAPDTVLTANTKRDWDHVESAFHHLMEEQRNGVHLVSKESEKFKPKPAEPSIWMDLAELAFQLGTGAVAGLVAKAIASRLSKAVVGAERAAVAAKQGQAEIAAAEKAATAARGSAVEERAAHDAVVAAKVGNYANEDVAKHTKAAESEIAAMTSSAVSKELTSAASAIHPKGAGNPTDKSTKDTPATSPDVEIAFFSDQASMVNDLEEAGADRLSSTIAEYVKRAPDVASDVMKGIKDGLDEAASQAKQVQADKTTAQFMTYLARTNLGTEQVNTGKGTETVTDMSSQRDHGKSKLAPSSLGTGVLEIDCQYTRGGSVRVTDARTNNVSWLTSKHLKDQHLSQAGVPIRISLGGPTMITRDEAGRVRVSGTLDLEPPFTEEQQVREAERIVDVVLSKSLGEWGVAQIQTNDADQPATTTTAAKGGSQS